MEQANVPTWTEGSQELHESARLLREDESAKNLIFYIWSPSHLKKVKSEPYYINQSETWFDHMIFKI